MIKYTIVQVTSDEEFGAFVGHGDVDDYPEPYRSYARHADSGQEFSLEIEGTMHNNLIVRSEPVEE